MAGNWNLCGSGPTWRGCVEYVVGACVALGKTKRISKTCVVVCLQDDDQEDMVDLVHAAHSNLATFHSQCAQKLFRKPKRILAAMKGVVESFGRAKLRALAKRWAERLEEFAVVKKTSKKSDALAYAYFNYAGGTKKSPKEVSELTRAARRCGEAMRGDAGGFSSDSSRTSNSSPEKRKRSSFRGREPGSRPYQARGYQRQFPQRQQFIPQPAPATARKQETRACYTCKQMGHLARDCSQSMNVVIKKEG